MSPSVPTIKALFAKSGNQCAFPGCDAEMVEEDGLVVGHVAHIEGVKGPHHRPGMADKELHGLTNLLLLCYRHHRRIDQLHGDYPVERLHAIRKAHAAQTVRASPRLTDEQARHIQAEIEGYWYSVRRAHERAIAASHPEVHADFNAPIQTQFAELEGTMEYFWGFREKLLSELPRIPGKLEKMLQGRRFEDVEYPETKDISFEPISEAVSIVYHGMANQYIHARLILQLIKVKHLQAQYQHEPGSHELKAAVDAEQRKFRSMVEEWNYID